MPIDMKNRRRILVILLLVLAVLFLILLTRPWDLPGRDMKRIALRNTEDVDRIVLVDSLHTTELIKEEGTWYLFGTESVNPVPLENLLIAASRLEASSIIGIDAFEGTGEFRGDAREIAFYRGNKILLAYQLSVVSGRYLVVRSSSEKAFYVALPGYPGLDLDRVFSANPDHYRDHLLIDLPPSDISMIEIELPSGEAFRFVQDTGGNILYLPLKEVSTIPAGPPNELAMKLLFSYFTPIRFEKTSGILSDSLVSGAAGERYLATVRVHAFSGELHSLQVFSYHEHPGSDPDLFLALVIYDHGQDAIIVNYIYLDVLMRGLSHYFGEK
jgi:hypothetical protein